MKKTLFYIILPFLTLIAASLVLPAPEHTGMRLKADFQGDSSPGCREKRLSGIRRPIASAIEEELKYYFDRHNVQDEGYEMVVAFANGHRHQIETDSHFSPLSVGTWKNSRRHGTCVALDSLGRTIVATCNDDTLGTGWRPDTLGTYIGDFHGDRPGGHGAYLTPDGGYFEGHWEHGRRQGFGIELLMSEDEEPRLRVGEWTRGRFQGERMRYTSERIYGIDIARYQHGHGRKHYAINWKQMRITYLGHKGSRNVSGTADYPVSFLYIKSTEGISVRNRHYAADYRQARRHAIPTGAYHFFSVRTGGTAQAQFFLRNTYFNKGDLPPVLDLEPSDAQIRQMGGAERLFDNVRTWLRLVEQRTGTRPILYVNQRFVNVHLPLAPDLKRNYRVWIARYGEYKPDVRLTYWQLSSDGRVSGIRGDVDINVFNGYKSQFEDFLEQETIK